MSVQLREAMGRIINDERLTQDQLDMLLPVFDAARSWLDFQTNGPAAHFKAEWKCEACGGEGYIDPPPPKDIYTCPSCNGRGWLPPEEAVEHMAEADWDEWLRQEGIVNPVQTATWEGQGESTKRRHKQRTETALVAFVEWMEEDQ